MGKRGGIRARAWRGMGGLHRDGRQIPRRKGRASKKSLPRTSRRKLHYLVEVITPLHYIMFKTQKPIG